MQRHIFNITKNLLLIIAAFPLVGVLLFSVEQKIVQHEMLDELENQQLQTLTVYKDEIHWEKKGKEIWINNRLFDIKSFKKINDNYFFTGLFDDNETALITQLKDDFGNNPNKRHSLTLLRQLFQILAVCHEKGSISPDLSVQKKVHLLSTQLTSAILSDIGPPPKC